MTEIPHSDFFCPEELGYRTNRGEDLKGLLKRALAARQYSPDVCANCKIAASCPFDAKIGEIRQAIEEGKIKVI